MPAYLDAWCQREPAVEADVSLFLHGVRDSDPEVSVVFRADLADEAGDEALADAVKLLPPQSAEMLPVRLSRLLGWLKGDKKAPADTDLEAIAGEEIAATGGGDPPQRMVRYRGRRSDETRTLLTANLRGQLCPGDVVVLPWTQDMPATLGRKASDVPVDCFELANDSRQVARLTPGLIASRVSEAGSGSTAATVDTLNQRLQQAVRQFTEPENEEEEQAAHEALIEMAFDPQINNGSRFPVVDIVVHPAAKVAGVVLFGKPLEKPAPLDPFGGDDEASFDRREVKLNDHAEQVADWAQKFAKACLPLAETSIFRDAGLYHDDGKADPRFQAILLGVPLPRAEHHLLAKSGGHLPPPAAQRRQREQLGLPTDFRHEMTSLQLAQKRGITDDLLLHLIAAHHGYARPFVPVILDEDPPDVSLSSVVITGKERAEHPPHALGSGVADRFWRLTRRYGWWGLAYLEAILRLADHHASRFPDNQTEIKDV